MDSFHGAGRDAFVDKLIVIPKLLRIKEVDKSWFFLCAFHSYLSELQNLFDLSILQSQLQLFLSNETTTFIFIFIFYLSACFSSTISSSSSSYSEGSSNWERDSSVRVIELSDPWFPIFLFPQVAKCTIFFLYCCIKFYF